MARGARAAVGHPPRAAPPGGPLSVSPPTWSHAAYISACQRYARKMHALRGGLAQRLRASGEAIG
ncbi:MAG: hypothetical protein FJ028_05880 [Chloroflexi bacterium]|nr:hypothetical protein [Chloroflexota bacterium]